MFSSGKLNYSCWKTVADGVKLSIGTVSSYCLELYNGCGKKVDKRQIRSIAPTTKHVRYKSKTVVNEGYQISKNKPRVTAGQLIFEILSQNGVSCINGYSGGAVLPLIDVFANPPEGHEPIPFHVHANEAAAGHAAEGYSKVSGKLGCCVVTSGPGLTNCITPMQDCKADGVPVLFISGQVPTNAVGKGSFQEVEAVEVSRPVTKWTFCITDVRDVGWVTERAVKVALEGRPGPVHIDVPKDTLTQWVPTSFDPFHEDFSDRKLRKYNRAAWHKDRDINDVIDLGFGSIYTDNQFSNTLIGDIQNRSLLNKLDQVVSYLQKCEKPLIHIGKGAIASYEIVRELAEYLQCPVTSTLHGMGIVSERDPLSTKMIGMHGSVCGNYALQESDLILNFGARFDDRTIGTASKFAVNAFKAAELDKGGVTHFDIDPSMFGKSGLIPSLAVLGNLKDSLPLLLEKVKKAEINKRDWKDWTDKVSAWKENYPFYVIKDQYGRLKGQEVVKSIDKYLEEKGEGDNKIVTTGVGNHQMYSCQFFTWSLPGQFVSSGGLGTMGVGLPFAIGARLAAGLDSGKYVISIDGDGSFNMSSNDLQTIKRYNLPMAIFIINDHKQSMVSSWQDFFFEGRQYITNNMNPDYVNLADSYGIDGYRISSLEKLNELLPEIMERSLTEPIVVDCLCLSDYTFPMCIPGTSLDETCYTLSDLKSKGNKHYSAPS